MTTPEEKILFLKNELEKSREHIRKLKEEVTEQRLALERRNQEVDALGRVWCDGGCSGGMDRYRKKGEAPPSVTPEQIAFLLRNARRAYSWYVNRGGRLEKDYEGKSLKQIWKFREKDIVAAVIEQHKKEIENIHNSLNVLHPEEYDAFLKRVDEQPGPTAAMLRLFRRHKK